MMPVRKNWHFNFQMTEEAIRKAKECIECLLKEAYVWGRLQDT